MITKVKSCGLMGMDGFIVDVEIDISNGIPAFEVVGLPDASVKESKERVRAAVKNSGFNFPTKRIIMNLAPANQKKEGSSYDLPIAMAILKSTGQVNFDDDCLFIGEVSLNGEIKPVNGVLPMVITAAKAGLSTAVVPSENVHEASIVKGVTVYKADTLKDIAAHFNGHRRLESLDIDIDHIFKNTSKYDMDFKDVKGQENVKRCLEIAAAGNHNVLLIGSPGTGKTMIAQRLPGILPDMTFEEALETTKIYSVSGKLPSNTPILGTRPFRNPHHTISSVGLAGGGKIPKPGEISLAHNGVLFFDELPEFRKDVLEVMRQPLEDRKITVSRINASLTYPCNIMFVGSMNPCKCGYYGDPNHKCVCTNSQIQAYFSKISGPLLDRIDIHVEVSAVNYDDLSKFKPSETSETIRQRVNLARKIQIDRFNKLNVYSNSQMQSKHIEYFCRLKEEQNKILKMAFEKFNMSARAYTRILKVSRTIADLDGSENIEVPHITEAIQYRALDRKYLS